MSPILLPVLLVVLGLIAGYLINQLPGFKNFPGKNDFIWRVLTEVVTLIVVLTAFSNLSGQSDSKSADQLAWLERGIWVMGSILTFDCFLTVLTAWKHRTSEVSTEIDDRKRLEVLKRESEEIRQRQRENFKNLKQQVVIPLSLGDVPEEIHQPRFITIEDSPEPETAQPKSWLNLKRIFRRGDRPEAEIPSTQRLIDVFDRADLRLLILGKPGAGKTTLMLELAEQLLEEAQQSGCDKIPIRLECSEWKDDNQPLSDWLILKLKDRHKVPFELSRQWIERRQLVPLLDGLDELGLERQQKATNAIAKFIKDNNYPAMVVCCRQEEWQQARAAEAQEKQFGLNGAVYLEPLTDEQIQSYLQQVKKPQLWAHIQSSDLKALLPDWDTCNKDGRMPGLRSPLLLNMLLVAGPPIRSQSELFQAYIKEQFIRSGKSKYTEAQTRRYLTWLARQLKAEKTTEFEIENLQPSWLEHTWQLWIYRIIVGALDGLITGLNFGLRFGLFYGLLFGPVTGLIAGLTTGLIFGPLSVLDIPTINSYGFPAITIKEVINSGLRFGLFFGLLLGLFFALVSEPLNTRMLIFSVISIISLIIIEPILALPGELKSPEIYDKIHPNECMWNTAINFIFGSVIRFLSGISLYILFQLTTDQILKWEQSIPYCIAGGLWFSMPTLLLLTKHGLL